MKRFDFPYEEVASIALFSNEEAERIDDFSYENSKGGTPPSMKIMANHYYFTNTFVVLGINFLNLI